MYSIKHPLKVALVSFSPLVVKEKNRYSGFEIELWEAIAKKNNFVFSYQEHPFQNIISLVVSKKADVALAGLTINEKRERLIDFSYPTLHSGLRILVLKDRGRIKIWETLKFLLTQGYKIVLSVVLVEVGLVAVLANIPWAGKVLGMGVIIVGMATFGLFIAQVSAFIIFKKIKSSIKNYHDLAGKKVATVKETTSVSVLQKIGAEVFVLEKIKQAYEMLRTGKVDAVVFDAPVLVHFVQKEGARLFELAGDLFEVQNYGIALQSKSSLREIINRTLLQLGESGQYEIIYKKWFGDNTSMEL